MAISINQTVSQVTEQLAPSPEKEELCSMLSECLTGKSEAVSELIRARNNGELTQDEFEQEIKQEKTVTEAMLLTQKIIAKAELQKIVDAAFNAMIGAKKEVC